MNAIVLLLALLAAPQGIPPVPGTSGTVSGTLKSADGTPAAGARVSAVTRTDSLVDPAAEASLVSLTQADEFGHFLLDNIPQGRYYITAGRVDQPTYFPGTTDMSKGRVLLITAGSIVSGIDFVMNDGSIRTDFSTDGRPRNASVFLPIDVRIEGGGKIPVFANGHPPSIRLTRKSDRTQTEVALSEISIEAPLPPVGSSEFQVTVTGLPDGYIVKSLMYGKTDAQVNSIQLSAASAGARVPIAPPSTLQVTLAVVPLAKPATSGVRVTGKTGDPGVRLIYMSGGTSVLYSDGSFEFRGVPAGRQTILLLDSGASAGGLKGRLALTAGRTIAVGDRDIENVTLEPIAVEPPEIEALLMPGPATTHAPGPMPLPTIRGRVVEEGGKQPLAGGTVTVNGQSRWMYRVDADGRFEIPKLFPGTYKLEIGNFGFGTIRETVVVEEDDVTLDLTTLKL